MMTEFLYRTQSKDYQGSADILGRKRRFVEQLAATKNLSMARSMAPVSSRSFGRWMDGDPAFCEDVSIIIEHIAAALYNENYEAAKAEGKLSAFLKFERAALQPELYSARAIEMRAERALKESKVGRSDQIRVEHDEGDS